jgi:hypothetical protein
MGRLHRTDGIVTLLSDKATKLYLKGWQEIYEMLTSELNGN